MGEVYRNTTYLRYYGSTNDENVPGVDGQEHTFWLRLEENSGNFMLAGQEGSFLMPWLRAMCSCGWSAERRSTIDLNARWSWLQHVSQQ